MALQESVRDVPWSSGPLGTLRDTSGAGTGGTPYHTHVTSDIIQLTGDIDWDIGRGIGNISRWRFQ